MLKIIIFLTVSFGIFIFSLPSLRNAGSHGFWRFFAFESVLILILLNVDVWFYNPFSFLQVFSWILLGASLLTALHGFYLLSTMGRPEKIGDIEKTTRLVKAGAYRYIRHPLYASLFYLGWGAFLKHPSFVASVLAIIVSLFLTATARVEEKENADKFGDEYAEYMKTTKMFVPFLF